MNYQDPSQSLMHNLTSTKLQFFYIAQTSWVYTHTKHAGLYAGYGRKDV